MAITLYHNPRCSKSRQTLQLLEERGIQPEIIRYLDQPPTVAELDGLLAKLGLEDPRQLMRKKEAEYKALGLDDPALERQALLEAMHSHPKLIERPIVVNGDRARIGRPPEAVLEIL